MKNTLAIVTLSALLSACATGVPKQNSGITPAAIPAAQAVEQTAAAAGQPTAPRRVQVKARVRATSDPLPSTLLTEEIMFRYLSAEIAEQRGDWQGAYVNMLQVAQQTRDPRIARRAAEIALNAKRPEEAVSAIRLWRSVAPNSEEAAQYYLGFVLMSENLPEAKPLLAQRLKETRPPLLGTTILQTQRLLARAKDKAGAFALLEEILQPYKAVPESRLALAQSAFLKGDTARAMREARDGLAAMPTSDIAALTLAQVTPDKDQAAGSLAAFLKKNPRSREVRLAYARTLVENEKYDLARNEFKTLLNEQPQDLTVLYALGLLSSQSNNLAEAEGYLTTYLRILDEQPDEDRDPTQALLILSQIAEQRNDLPSAMKWLDQISPSTPQAYIGAQIKRAQLLAKSGDIAGARALLQAARIDGEDEQIQVVLAEAQLLRTADQLKEGMTVLEAGLSRFPENTDLLYDYAMLAEKANRLDVMETSLRTIMRIAPENQHAYNALGYSLAERNLRLEEASALISKALQLAPEDPFIMDSMGWVQFRLGRIAEAEKYLRRAYEIRPDAEIAVHLGEVLWVKGQQEDAKKLWRDANKKDPKNDALKSTLARLQVNL